MRSESGLGSVRIRLSPLNNKIMKIKVGDRVSFKFAGEPLTGEVTKIYKRSNVTKASVKGDCKNRFNYPVPVDSLTKIN